MKEERRTEKDLREEKIVVASCFLGRFAVRHRRCAHVCLESAYWCKQYWRTAILGFFYCSK